MRTLLQQKFQDPQLREMLLQTGNRPLIEGNAWNDTFWGECRGKGANNLGKLLEQLRNELQDK